MKKEHLLLAMKDSISEVLETMFFLPIDATEVVESKTFRDAIQREAELAEMKFSGIFSGSFLLLIPDDLALFLTASFLGSLEEKVLPEHVAETKKEIVNMVAGNTFANFDDKIVFDLGIPQIVSGGDLRQRLEGTEEIVYQCQTLDKFLFIRVSLKASAA
jgi:CheY-specific phosphatase CheX